MRKHLKIAVCYFRLNLTSALEYRASFFTQAFGMALSNSSFIFFWWVAFSQIGGRIADYSFEDILFIWATTSSAFGLAHILFSNTSKLTNLIVTGELDTFLLQPCNILVNVICAGTTLSAYGDFIYGFVLMAIVYAGNAMAWLWFFVGVVVGSLLMTAVTLAAHTLSFYFGDASVAGQMATEFFVNFSIYPEKIYAPLIRVIMYSIIPVGLAVHLPLRLLKEFSPVLLAAIPIFAVIYCSAAGWFFYKGLRRYESGNVIVMRQ